MTKEGKLTGQLVSDETKKDLAHAFYDFQPAVDIKVEYVAVDENHKAIVCSVGRVSRVDSLYVFSLLTKSQGRG